MLFMYTNVFIVSLFCAAGAFLTAADAGACTTILAGKDATADGSVLMSCSCDGSAMGYSYIMPAREYAEGERIPILYHGKEAGRFLPWTSATHRRLILEGQRRRNPGRNEYHGVSIGIEFIPMRPELDSTLGVVGP